MDGAEQTASVLGDGNVVAQAKDHSTIIIGGQRKLQLSRYEGFVANLANSDAQTALLSAYRRDVVALMGREREMAELRAWLETDGPISIHVLTGGAGRGKTRLAAELCCSLGEDWQAGFAGGADFEEFWNSRRTERWRWAKPTLIVLDYAASRVAALKGWLQELANPSSEKMPKLRLLLLERHANWSVGWLAELVPPGDKRSDVIQFWFDPKKPVGPENSEVEPLAPLDGLAFRRELFATLLKRVPPFLDAPEIGTDAEFDLALGEPRWGDPLLLMMAGLAAARAGLRKALSLSRTDLAEWMADQELERIGKLGVSRGIEPDASPPGRFLRRMAALVTLVQGGGAKTTVRALVEAERAATGAVVDLGAVVRALADALPASQAGEVGQILPNIVGEAALLRMFGDGGEAAQDGEDVEPRILAAAKGAVKAASAMLARTAQDFAATGCLEPIRWLESWADAPETDLSVLIQIADALPLRTLALRETAARLQEKICAQLARANEASPSDIGEAKTAESFRILSNRLGDLGRREEALVAARKAVDIFRSLAARRPNPFLGGFASALHDLGVSLSEIGRHDEALQAAREATRNYQLLADEWPEVFKPKLAMALNSFSRCLFALGIREEALERSREAVQIRRELAAKRDNELLADLAWALNNFGGLLQGDRLRSAERHEAVREATELYRRLASDQPDAFLHHFASALNTYSNSLTALGLYEEALERLREAEQIGRQLAAKWPDVFLRDLGVILNGISARLSTAGRYAEALVAADEAAAIFQRLAGEKPEAYLPLLAVVLDTLGLILGELGRREQAFAAVCEAIRVFAPLFSKSPRAHAEMMRRLVDHYAARVGELGQQPDFQMLTPIVGALEALQEPNREEF